MKFFVLLCESECVFVSVLCFELSERELYPLLLFVFRLLLMHMFGFAFYYSTHRGGGAYYSNNRLSA